ncbi:MAG: hypothetical protein AB8H80_18765 [Planctomycetota bacterium]
MTISHLGFRSLRLSAALLLLTSVGQLTARGLAAQSFFADGVASSNTNGGAGGGVFLPSNALGAPMGSTVTHSLGIQGDLTVTFSTAITNGPGADLIVSENPFRSFTTPDESFAEVCFVEVSSNGTDFVRFPARYFGPAVQPGAFGFIGVGVYSGLAGQTPVLVPSDPSADPRDVCEAGGDSFDLQDLAGEPLVLTGTVNILAITHVRLVDVESGVSLDATGTPIFDPGAGSADIDAVTAIHQVGSTTSDNPEVELSVQQDGTMMLRLSDPNGRGDLDPQSLRAAVWGLPIDAGGLLSAFTLQTVDANGYTLVQSAPLPSELVFTLSFSLKDLAGNRSGMTRTRPGL